MTRPRLPILLLLLCAASFGAGMARAACPAPLQSAAYDQQIGGEIDQNLFNSAVLYYTNVVRCQRGLPPIASTQDVFRAALIQATNMTRTRTYDHTVNVRGARTLRDRMRTQTRNFRAAGENIAKNYVYILNGRPYIPAENCAFRYLDTRQPVPVHTYRNLAQELVAAWEASPEHLANIVNRRYTRMGAAFGIDAQGQLCGEVYAAQVFAG